jgi:hypothetical protein
VPVPSLPRSSPWAGVPHCDISHRLASRTLLHIASI